MSGVRAWRLALPAAILVGAVAAVSSRAGWLGLGNDSPLAVTRVPATLPARGVQLEADAGAVVLTPWATTPRGAMSAEVATAAARQYSSRPDLPATALKVDLSLPNGTIHDVPVWLVTFTAPKPIDLSADGLLHDYVTQFSEALNPVSGKVETGFDTPFPCLHADPGSSLDACEHGGTVGWVSKQELGDAHPTILREETFRDLGGNPETLAVVRGHFTPVFAPAECAALFREPCGTPPRASLAWVVLGNEQGARVTTASQIEEITKARDESPLFSIFPDFAYDNPTVLCAIPIAGSAQTIAASCSTTFIAPRTIQFLERWPVSVPAGTHPKRSGWIVTLDKNANVRSIRQFGVLPPQLRK